MSFFKWFLGGLIGAGIGAAIWVAVGYFSNYEIGYIAWAIGLFAGIGVRAFAGDDDGYGPGAAAVGTAVFAILVAKYLVISLSMNAMLEEFANADSSSFSREDSIAMVADEIVEELPDAEAVVWPVDESVYEDDDISNDYPADLWKQATEKWDSTPTDQQQAIIEKRVTAQNEMMNQFADQMKGQAFKAGFSPIDLLWFGLAAFTAFKVGSGLTEED